MAFPSTSVLDNGSRSDENPISNGSLWGGRVRNADYLLQLVTNKIVSVGAGGFGSQAWGATLGPDVEIYTKYGSAAPFEQIFDLFLRISNPNSSSMTGYMVRFKKQSSIEVQRIDNNVFTSISTQTGITMGAASEIGVRMVGDTLYFFVDGASVGTPVVDSTYSGSGKIGLELFGTTHGLDYLGGGTYTPALPVNTAAPLVTGSLQQGGTLDVTTGTWSNSPTSYAYQWKVADTASGPWSNLSGQTANSHTNTSGDVGKFVKCTITATNAAGSVSQDSNVVGPVTSTGGPAGTFPSTATLDDTERANENPLSQASAWTNGIIVGDANMQLLSNRIVSQSGSWGGAYRATTYGPDCEVWGDMDPDSSTGWEYWLALRLASPDTSGVDGYIIKFVKYVEVRVDRLDNGVMTNIAVFPVSSMSSTARVGARMVGNTIYCFVDGSLVGTISDSTYTAAGKIGVILYGATNGYTVVGGGTYVGPVSTPFVPRISFWVRHHPIVIGAPPPPPPPPPGGTQEGHINTFSEWASPADQFTRIASNYTFYRAKLDRILTYGGAPSLVYSNMGDRAWYYNDIAAVYNEAYNASGTPFTSTPQYVLRDAPNGALLYIPYGAIHNGGYPQFAGDHGMPAWRTADAQRTQSGINVGCQGSRLDDVNPGGLNTAYGSGVHQDPYDPRTGATMTLANWRRYIAEHVEFIKASFPGHEILSNMPWFSGNNGNIHGWNDPYIARIIDASDYIEIERGINDAGVTGDNWTWGIITMMQYIDYIHSRGTGILWHTYASAHADLEYQLAMYFLMSNGNDYVGGIIINGDPATFWDVYEWELGPATSARFQVAGQTSVWRRNFQDGVVLVNVPGAASQTVALGGTFRDVNGTSVTSAVVGGGRGRIFRR